MSFQKQYPMVTTSKDRKVLRRVANSVYIAVRLVEPFSIKPALSYYLDAIRQIDRHVDDVEIAAVEFEDIEFQSLSNPKVIYASRAQALVSEALAAKTGELATVVELNVCSAQFKRREQDEKFTSIVNGTFEELVCAAFDNDVFEIVADSVSHEQLVHLKAVRNLRESLSTSE